MPCKSVKNVVNKGQTMIQSHKIALMLVIVFGTVKECSVRIFLHWEDNEQSQLGSDSKIHPIADIVGDILWESA